MAADLVTVADTTSNVSLRIVNHAGHKLISGFPEGRRMWLNVKFYDADTALIGEINPYTPLVVTTDSKGNRQYISGGVLTHTRDDLIYEASMSSALTGEDHTFHFVLATIGTRITGSRPGDSILPARLHGSSCRNGRARIVRITSRQPSI